MQKPTKTTFLGSCRPCANPNPHYPHIVGHYQTVVWGGLERFCPGKYPGEAGFKILKNLKGNPHVPSKLVWVCQSPTGVEINADSVKINADSVLATLRQVWEVCHCGRCALPTDPANPVIEITEAGVMQITSQLYDNYKEIEMDVAEDFVYEEALEDIGPEVAREFINLISET